MKRAQGFTLVEMIMVITITGILGGIVAMFLRAPVQQFTDLARRTDMSDIADIASHRVVHDLRLGLANSVRITGTCDGTSPCYLEFIPTKALGRYRSVQDPAGNASAVLDTGTLDTEFEVLGNTLPPLAAGDELVIYNATSTDAYQAITTTGVRVDTLTLAGNILSFPAHQFAGSPQWRFSIVNAPVSYVCNPNPTTPSAGTLTRHTGYGFLPVQPTTLGAGNLLAQNVNFCRFSYDPASIAARFGLVTIDLGISEGGESIKLYTTAHVSNQP